MNRGNRAAAGRRHLGRLRRDGRGMVALEFALVAAPLVVLIAGALYSGLNLTAMSALDNGARDAAHHLRVTSGSDADDSTVRATICNFVHGFTNCGDIKIYVQNGASFAALPPPPVAATVSGFNPGGSGSYVLMQVVFQSNLALSFAGVSAPVFSSTIVFRNE